VSEALAKRPAGGGDLSITALYTAGVWAWAGLPGAELLDHKDARRVLGTVNGALALARPFYRKPPSLKHSLVQRHVMIDAAVAASGARHVLEIAAGLSQRGAAATVNAGLTFVELDRAPVIARKRELLARSEAGRAVLARPNLRLVPGDALETPTAELAAALAAPARAPVCVVAEGLLMYLDAAAQARLHARVAELCAGRPGSLYLFDLVPAIEQPRPGWVGRALAWLMRKATRGGDFVRDDRSRDEVAAAVRAAGFAEVQMLEPRDAPAAWRVPHLDRRTQQLLFVARVV
jgi:O-methyltransferase involved in polyketide biosynthesis